MANVVIKNLLRHCFLTMSQIRPLFVYFRSFLKTNIVQYSSIKEYLLGVLGIRTWDRMMVGADKSTELWRLPRFYVIVYKMGHSRPLFLYFRLFYKQLINVQ